MRRKISLGVASIASVLAVCTTSFAGDSNCCFANGGLGCDDAACQAAVCGIDPFCCATAWDGICANEALQLCAVCAGGGVCPGRGDCCTANGGLGCNDADCCNLVCGFDPFCCETAWDGICASEAVANCAVCAAGPCPGAGDCCSANGGLGCNDEACCNLVCGFDPFCCETAWDS